jgi:hypothetical protein
MRHLWAELRFPLEFLRDREHIEPRWSHPKDTTMRATWYASSAALKGIGAKPRFWRRLARAFRRFDRDERFSPLICIATLLIVGIAVKFIPVVQTQLHH